MLPHYEKDKPRNLSALPYILRGVSDTAVYSGHGFKIMRGVIGMIEVIKPKRAVEILRENGHSTMNEEKLKYGIEQGKYPFGVAIHMASNWVYDIYVSQLQVWIAERSGENVV